MISEPSKAVVTVTEMARLVALSRARFYELVKEGVFPPPVYCVRTRRPLYVEELQRVCLEVRRQNCGANGRPVLFYSVTRPSTGTTKPVRKVIKPMPRDEYATLTAAVRSLGLTMVTAEQVATAVKNLYPNGIAGVNQPEVIRAVFLQLQRRDCTGNVR